MRSEEKTGVLIGNRGRQGCPERFRRRKDVLGNMAGLQFLHEVLLNFLCNVERQLVGRRRVHLMERMQRAVAKYISAVQIVSG